MCDSEQMMVQFIGPVNAWGTIFLTIGDRLKEERTRLRLTQPQMAETGGVGKNTQINYEKGERSPDSEYLARVSAIGVDVLYVVTGTRSDLTPGALSAEESALIENYRKSSISDRAFLQRLGMLTSETVDSR
jgi:transcriptional regulator with XRE-family HTH domain